jgi:tellurite resistance protein
MPAKLSHHYAMIYAMVTTSAVDRQMVDPELKRIGEIVSNLPSFQDFDADLLVAAAEDCGKVLSAEDGLDTVLTLIAEGIPEGLRETVYAVSVEVAVADLTVKPEELRFLQLLRDTLGLDRLITAAIERGIRARNMTLV